MNKNIKFGISMLLISALLLGAVMVPSVSAEKIDRTNKDGKKIVEISNHVSKHEILLDKSEIGILGLSNPTPSTEGLTLVGSDSDSCSNIWGSLLYSYRMYSVDNEADPDNDYYVVWVQSTGKGTAINKLNYLWSGIKDLNNGQIVDWSPAGTVKITDGQSTTVTLGVDVGVTASISQTFDNPSGKLYPDEFTTTQFQPEYSSTCGTYDPAFCPGGVLIKSPTGESPTFTWYTGLI